LDLVRDRQTGGLLGNGSTKRVGPTLGVKLINAGWTEKGDQVEGGESNRITALGEGGKGRGRTGIKRRKKRGLDTI